MVIRVSDKKKNYSKVTKLLVKPLKNMFEYKAGNKTLNEWATAFCKRKYNSDFSKEMTNSVQKYIDQFKSEAD